MTLSNPLRTPRRPNHPVGFTTPTVVLIQNPQDWRNSNHDDMQITPFMPNTSIPFDTSILAISMSPQIHTRQSGFNSWMPRESKLADPRSGSGLSSVEFRETTDMFQSKPSTQVATTFAAPAPATDFNTLYATIMSTIPPTLLVAPVTPAPVNSWPGPSPLTLPQNPSTEVVLHESSVLRNDQVLAQASRASSVTPGAGHGSEDIWHSSVVPSGFRLPRALLPPPRSQPDGPHPGSLRQGDFTHDQVSFNNQMKHRWSFYLSTEDPFPINVLPAQELCMSYAEKVLGVTRMAYQISQCNFDYVCRKDSNIRNGFLSGLLKDVEQDYDVTTASGSKIDRLVLNMNFAHKSFDVATKKIHGHYCHPCIMKAIKIMLFTKRSRGRPVGVRFIREIMGDAPEESNQSARDLVANTGAPIATIALACTLSIKAGDSSKRKLKTVKPIKFSEQKYGGTYRTILARLKQYPRLTEVRKAYMEDIMKEYLVVQASSNDDSDGEELAFDDEMMSNGE
ncbi:hypothetical protein FRC06_007764 [Ceratobasidium sp. 370]|nr:hypothetical protein FRC06_007764 [Ceratobasidium sp. 370]